MQVFSFFENCFSVLVRIFFLTAFFFGEDFFSYSFLCHCRILFPTDILTCVFLVKLLSLCTLKSSEKWWELVGPKVKFSPAVQTIKARQANTSSLYSIEIVFLILIMYPEGGGASQIQGELTFFSYFLKNKRYHLDYCFKWFLINF